MRVGDVRERIREARAAYDLILLDVDNGPDALIHEANAGLYDAAGIVACHAALKKARRARGLGDGAGRPATCAFWSAADSTPPPCGSPPAPARAGASTWSSWR